MSVNLEYELFINLESFNKLTKEDVYKIKQTIIKAVEKGDDTVSQLVIKNKQAIDEVFIELLNNKDILKYFLKLYGFWVVIKENGLTEFLLDNYNAVVENALKYDSDVLIRYAIVTSGYIPVTDEINNLKKILFQTPCNVRVMPVINSYLSGKKISQEFNEINFSKIALSALRGIKDNKDTEYFSNPLFVVNSEYKKVKFLFKTLNLFNEYMEKYENIKDKVLFQVSKLFKPAYYTATKRVFSFCDVCDNETYKNIFKHYHQPFWSYDSNIKKTFTRDINNVFTLEGDDVNGYRKTIVANYKEILPICYDEKIKDYIFIDSDSKLKTLNGNNIRNSLLSCFVDVNERYKFVIKESKNKYSWMKINDNVMKSNYGTPLSEFLEINMNEIKIVSTKKNIISSFIDFMHEPIAHFPFTEDNKEVRNRFIATARWSQDPVFNGKEAIFDGYSGYSIDIPSSVYENFTISLWIKDAVHGIPLLIFGTDYCIVQSLDAVVLYGNDKNHTVYLEAIRDTCSGENFIETGMTLSTNKWHQLTISGNTDIIRFFIDGELKKEGTNWFNKNNVKKNTYIGVHPWDSESYYNGKLKNLKIYNTMLSEEEVYLLYVLEGENNA